MISQHAFGEVISSDGKVNNVWNVGVNMLIANITGHHIQVILETKSFDVHIIFWYMISYSTVFATIYLNDSFIMESYVSVYYAN